MSPKLSLVVAMAENRVIGRAGGLPWHLPADLRHFKELTLGHALIMGRRTFESIGRPLPGRRTLVLSRSGGPAPEGVEVVASLDEALERTSGEQEVFAVGGAGVYAAALPLAETLYLTLIHAEVEGDVHFPVFDENHWRLAEEEHRPADARNAFAVTFRRYDRAVPRGCE